MENKIMNGIPCSITYRDKRATTVTVVLDGGQTFSLSEGHSNFKIALKELAKANPDKARVKELFNPAQALQAYVSGSRVTIVNGQVYYNGELVHNVVADRIKDFMRDGHNYKPLMLFLENIMLNPSRHSRDQGYSFLEYRDLVLTPDGCFLAYKGVTEDNWSVSSGTIPLLKGKVNELGQIYNGVGEEIIVDRREVDDNPNAHCSYGLHVGTFSYAKGFGPKVVLCKVNPKDIVSVPNDCSCQKCRVAAYVVQDEYVADKAISSALVTDEGKPLVDDDFETPLETCPDCGDELCDDGWCVECETYPTIPEDEVDEQPEETRAEKVYNDLTGNYQEVLRDSKGRFVRKHKCSDKCRC